jgi:hypothetical protein
MTATTMPPPQRFADFARLHRHGSLAAVARRGPAAVVAVLSALIELHILDKGGFFLDDFRNIGAARAGLSLRLLFTPIGGYRLQPVNRFLEWLTATPLHTSYAVAVVVYVVIHGFGTYWLIRLLDAVWGPRRFHLLVGFLFGTSLVLIAASQWVATAATSTVAVDFAAGACLGFAYWLSTGRWWTYALGLVATALAVCSWETALVVPATITIIWACFARGWQPVRRALLAQVPFYVVALAFLVYVELQPWHQALILPTVGAWLALLLEMVGRELPSSLVGTGAPGGALGSFQLFSVVVPLVVLGAAAGWLVRRRRFEWLAPVVFVVTTVLVSTPIATTRDYLGGGVAATTPRYVTFLPLLFAISVAGAVRPRPNEREGRADHPPPWHTIAVTVAALAFCGAYLFNLVHSSFNANEFGIQSGRAGMAEADRVGAGVAALGRAGERSLIDSTVPYPIYYPMNDGSSELGDGLLPYWSTTARTFGEGRIAGVDLTTGVVRWASFHDDAGGTQLKYVRVVVRASAATTMVVRIAASQPTQPEVPWRISMPAGAHSVTLAAWATAVRSVSVRGPHLSVLSVRPGTVTLGAPVA